jgi:dolichyl-phosphate beta-glucosyltransferase
MLAEIAAVLVGCLVLYFLFAPLLLTVLCCRNRQTEEHVYQFQDPNELVDGYRPARVPFPSLFDRENLVYLSVVMPLRNEGRRLALCLSEAISFLRERRQRDKHFTFEVVLVDDASVDSTATVAMDFAQKFGADVVRLLRLERRSGVGFAAKQGALVCRGMHVLVLDINNNPNFSKFQDLEYELGQMGKTKDSMGVSTQASLQPPADWLKGVARGTFSSLSSLFSGTSLRDPMPGMKLMNRRTAQLLFPALATSSAAYNAELVFLASRLQIPFAQIVSQSSAQVQSESSQLGLLEWMVSLRDLLMIKLGYQLRFWQVPRQQQMMLGPSVARQTEAKVFSRGPGESFYGGNLTNLNTSMMSVDGDRNNHTRDHSQRSMRLNQSRGMNSSRSYSRPSMSARKPTRYSRPNTSMSSTPYGGSRMNRSGVYRQSRENNMNLSKRYGHSAKAENSYDLSQFLSKNDASMRRGGNANDSSMSHHRGKLNDSRILGNASVNMSHRRNESGYMGNLRRSFAS